MSDSTTESAAGAGQRVLAVGVLAVVAAVVVGGGWLGYRAVYPAPRMAVAGDFRADPIISRGPRAARANPPAAVSVSPGQVVTVRASDLVLNAAGRPDGSWRLNFSHRGNGPKPDAQAIELLSQRRRLVEMRTPPAALKLTAGQRAALAALPANPPELSADAAARVVDLCKQLVKLPVADAKAAPLKKELESLVSAAGKSDRTALVAAYAERAQQVRAVLSPEQVQILLTPRTRPETPARTPST